jgi:hypothetical protein
MMKRTSKEVEFVFELLSVDEVIVLHYPFGMARTIDRALSRKGLHVRREGSKLTISKA